MKRILVAVMAAIALMLPVGCFAADMSYTPQARYISVGNHTNYGSSRTGSTFRASSSRVSSSRVSSSEEDSGESSWTFGGESGDESATSGRTGGTSGGSGNAAGTVAVLLLFGWPFILVAVFIVMGLLTGSKKKPAERQPQGAQLPKAQSQDDIVSQIRAHDPNFDPEGFIDWSKQVFIQLQQAWKERDWKKARPFESESLFNQHKAQLDEYINNHTINIMENVCVNEAYLYKYVVDGRYEYLTAFMQTSYNDYIIDERTKSVVRGDPDRRYDVNYLARFMRTVGVTTDENSNASTTRCPNCGAPVDVNAAGECAYCGTVITNGDHDWVLCNLDDVRG